MLDITTINHHARREAGLSNDEYCLVDLIARLSNNPPKYIFCTLTKENMANDLGMTRQGVIKMLARLEAKGYIEDAGRGRLRSTNAWYEVVNKVYIESKLCLQTKVNKVYIESKQSLHNSINTEVSKIKDTNKLIFPEKELPNAVLENRRKAQQSTALNGFPLAYPSDTFKEAWGKWVSYLTSRYNRVPTRETLESHDRILRTLAKTEAEALAIMAYSIEGSCAKFYAPTANGKKSSTGPAPKNIKRTQW